MQQRQDHADGILAGEDRARHRDLGVAAVEVGPAGGLSLYRRRRLQVPRQASCIA